MQQDSLHLGKRRKRREAQGGLLCDEQQAYIHEADRIAEYGLENLTNAVLYCSLVSDKKKLHKYADSARLAFDVIKALAKHFASYVRLTQLGKYKLNFGSQHSVSAVLCEQFYNEMAPKVVGRVMKSDEYRKRFADLMLKHDVEIVFQQA